MYLEEVILDGFKSYANRTVIGPFHPKFNAISGPNGTGKSNILDAICFVMGIKSLTQMRVSKLEELIYKQGQAGISKASVTLIFRNTDRQTSPVGLADIPKISITRQIAIGGRERFLLNGHNVQMADIQRVFQSVQLNVNHPHFLVVQGRITKVINMKPTEVLGMIEESAGTRLYEIKRSESAKKIAIKESKLEEINTLVTEEIEPAIVRLRKEQEEYSNSLRLSEDITRLEKKCCLHEFYTINTNLSQIESRTEKETTETEELKDEIIKAKKQLTLLNQNATEEKERNLHGEQELRVLQEEEKWLSNDVIVLRVQLQELRKDRENIEDEIKRLEEKFKKIEQEQTDIRIRCDKDLMKEKRKQEEVKEARKQLDDLKILIEEARTGCVSNTENKVDESQGYRQTVRDKILATDLQIKAVESEIEMSQMSVKKWEQDIQSLTQNEASSNVHHYAQEVRTELMETEQKIDTMSKSLQDEDKISGQIKVVQKAIQSFEIKLSDLEDTIATLNRSLFHITRVHEENPDGRSQGIRGVAAELLRVKEECHRYTLALEEAGKSRLFNIVVDDDDVAKRLLEKYKSVRRITCIPLNRIRCKEISDEAISLARKVAEVPSDSLDVVRPIDAFSCKSPEYSTSLMFVFGHVYLCASSSIAQKISGNPLVKGLAITLQGDHYNPAGSVSGGSQCGLNGLLDKLDQLHSAREDFETVQSQLIEAKEQYSSLHKAHNRAKEQAVEYEGLRVLLETLKSRLREAEENENMVSLACLTEKRNKAIQHMEELTTVILPNLRDVVLPRLREQQQVLEGSEISRKKHIDQCQTQIEKLKGDIARLEDSLKNIQDENSNIHRQTAVLTRKLVTTKEQLDCKRNEEFPSKAELENKALVTYNDKMEKLSALKERISQIAEALSTDSRIDTQLTDTKQVLEGFVIEAEAKITMLSHSLRQAKKTWSLLAKKRSALLREHGWLVKDGKVATDTDKAFDVVEGLEKLDSLRQQYDAHRRKSRNVISLLEASERELHELKEKKTQLIRDKRKLEEFIEELDIKKRDVLEACWKQVDEYFSRIFSSFLPSCDAHLCLTSSNKIDDGLEMRITLTGVTKKYLGELSGGQKSLLALSLILGLLKYKPAPFYILDEIDAALDLSHTQRIGYMVKSQFDRSQFLIVSLKENLFNYADVLFRTSFKKGTSCVTRHTQEENPRKRKNSETSITADS